MVKKRRFARKPKPALLPLAVDLDGTLIRGDLLLMSLRRWLWQRPLQCWQLPLWLGGGRAGFKHQIAQQVDLDIAGLPYRSRVVEFLQAQRDSGRSLVLATAANQKYAHQVAIHLGLFDAVLASDATHNVKGPVKARVLVNRFGRRGFVYVGDSRADLAVWTVAAAAVLVAPSGSLSQAVAQLTTVEQVLV